MLIFAIQIYGSMKYVKWLWQHTTGIRLNMAVRIVAGTGRVALGLLMVWLCKRFIDVTIHTGNDDDILAMCVALLVVVAAQVALRQVYYYLGERGSARQSTGIRLKIFSALFLRPLFDSSQLHSGDITSRLEKDIDVVSQATTSLLPDLTVAGIQLLGAFLLMQTMDTRLAWALLILTPLFVVTGKLIARRMRHMTLEVREHESQVQMLVQETMEHQDVLRSLDSADYMAGQLETMQQSLRESIGRRAQFTVVSRLLIAGSFSLGYIVAFIWGGLQLRAGVISFGVMTSFLQLVSQIQQPILQMLNMLPGVIHATASIDRLEELNTDDSQPAISVGNHQSGIRFKDVSFQYANGDREILKHFTHTFEPGSKTAIMGETGIGKTTLFRLILGLIEPLEGRIEVGGGICFVPQGNTLMSGTIRYNLLLAKPDTSDDELREVLHTACADFVMELPKGLDTVLGERGGRLSEGQAQRIAIARGLLRPGNILLLDEISAALDENTERELFSRLFAACPDKTMLLITHRTAVGQLCDEVIKIGF